MNIIVFNNEHKQDLYNDLKKNNIIGILKD